MEERTQSVLEIMGAVCSYQGLRSRTVSKVGPGHLQELSPEPPQVSAPHVPLQWSLATPAAAAGAQMCLTLLLQQVPAISLGDICGR